MTSDNMQGTHNRANEAGFMRMRASVLLLAAAVVVGIFALVSLSERSVPGDALYGFELSVVEPVSGAFRFTSDARAKYHFDRLVERLTETRDVAFVVTDEERTTLLAPVAYNIAHQVQSILSALEGRSDDAALNRAIDAVAILELYEATFYFEESDLAHTLGEAVDDTRARFADMMQTHRDRYTLPELEAKLVEDITKITDEAQTATPYTLGRVTENLYDILATLESGDVLGAYDIMFNIKIDLAKDRFSQALLG